MFSIDSIKKVVAIGKEAEKKYIDLEENQIKECISSGNKKIGRVMNVSLMPIMTCSNCKECKHLCYDIKACLQYPTTVIDARMRNTVLAKYHRDVFFARISAKMFRRRKNKFFRWHVAGDILDLDYFHRMVKNAIDHPDFTIWTYTKNYKVVNEYCGIYGKESIPSNFSIMFSEWDGMPMDNPYNFPVFSCKLKSGNKNRTEDSFRTMYKCPGNCDICKAINRGCIVGENTYCDEH